MNVELSLTFHLAPRVFVECTSSICFPDHKAVTVAAGTFANSGPFDEW